MGRIADALQSIMATLWVGGMWAIGYVVAPVLFSRLGDRALAGLVAGKLFSLIAWIGIASAVYLLVFRTVRYGSAVFKQGVFWIVLLMLALVCAGEFGIQPIMAALKAEALPKQVMESVLRDRFSAWHGVSSVLYIIQSLLGATLIVLLGRSK
jgi:MFS family permease